MTLSANCPLARGMTDTEGGLAAFRGRVFTVRDLNSVSGVGANTLRTNDDTKVMVVKNSSGITLLPSRLVVFKAGTNMQEVDGYTTTTAAEAAGIVDPLLTNGVLDGDDFLIVVDGICTGLTAVAPAEGNVITEGSYCCSLTAAASTGGSTAECGRLVSATVAGLTGATLVLANSIRFGFFRALSAKTTANTAATILGRFRAPWL